MESNSFIKEINALIAHDKKHQQEQLSKGECFNIFQVMGMASDEVHTHSSLIAELLNSHGSHGCGDKFLQLFIKYIPELQDLNFNTKQAQTRVEYPIGEITKDYEEGGRIDILIEADGKAIVIENKIYAGDQPKQLWRYYKYSEKKYNNHKLLYLTLNGKDPSKESTYSLSEDKYICVSYANNVMKWVNDCIKNVENKPHIKIILTQYKKIIQSLTCLTIMSEETKKQLTETILNNAEYIKNLNAYSYAIETSKKTLSERFWNNLLEAMKSRQYKNNLRVVEIDGEKYNSKSATKKDISISATNFLLSSQRYNYKYRFGLAIPIDETNNQRLMVGIIIDSAITFRVYVENSNGDHIPVPKVTPKFKHIQETLGSNAFPERSGWPNDFYICVKRQEGTIERWNFAEMKDEALDNLSNMENCVNTLLKEYDGYLSELRTMLRNE